MQTTSSQLSVQLSVLLATLCAVFLLIGGAADAGAPPSPTVEYVVREGDTLWDIATSQVLPQQDVRLMVMSIRERSGITSSVIHPGQILQIPRP